MKRLQTNIDIAQYTLRVQSTGNIQGVIARAQKKGFVVMNDDAVFQAIKHQGTNYDALMKRFNNREKMWCDFREGRQIITHIYQQLADHVPARLHTAVRIQYLRVLKEFRDDIYRADLYARG